MKRTLAERRSVIPGFGLTLGFALLYLSVLVLLPLSTLVLRASSATWYDLWRMVSAPSALASYKLSFGAAACAAGVNAVFGCLVAWVLTRYRCPGRRILDALVDLPFALPTSVAAPLSRPRSPPAWHRHCKRNFRLPASSSSVCFTRAGGRRHRGAEEPPLGPLVAPKPFACCARCLPERS